MSTWPLVLLAALCAVPCHSVSPASQKAVPVLHFDDEEQHKSVAQGKCNVHDGKMNNRPEFKRWLPTCLAHLKDLVHTVDRSYTDIQLETVLEHECMYEEHFPLSQDDGFQKTRHCQEFSCLLTSARDAQLEDKSTAAYTRACEEYWILIKGVKVENAKAPVFTDETMPAVSTTLWCIINLTLQYFALYTAVVVVRTLISFKFDKLVGVQHILETGCTTVTYAPMLCVLFLGVRMRAIQLAQGQTEKYNLPQPWVQTSMVIASFAVFAQVILVLLVGVMSGASKLKTDEEGNLDVSAMSEFANPFAVKLLTVARYVVMAMLYGGFLAVVIGVFTMEGPKEIWGGKQLPVSPAVMCTILLSGFFFLVYLLVAITKTCFELSPKLRSSVPLHKLSQASKDAKMTVNFAPMLCILFIGARMRALQIDPMNGNPQSWAQKCFFMCTFSVLLQCLLVILMPFVAKMKECKQGAFEGDISFVMENPVVGVVMTAIRYVCLLALYGGIAAVVYSVFTIEHPAGPDKTPAVSPSMQCVINLTVQYFFVYIMLSACITLKSFASGGSLEDNDTEQGFQTESPLVKVMSKAIAIADAARGTVMFAPMLAILFIGARMRALQLARAQDGTISPLAGPQAWVQDGMFLATWAVFVQLIMTVAVPLLTGSDKAEVDCDGNIKVPQDTHKSLVVAAEVVRYLSLLCMYGGAMTVVVGIFVMTPDSLPPHNNRTLVPGVEVPKPLSVKAF